MPNVKLQLPPLRNWQGEYLSSDKRWSILVVHRRAGKTVIALLKILIKALEKPWVYAYIAPFYSQAKRIAFDIINGLVKQIPGVNINKSELLITLPNGSKIYLLGADNPDSLRGMDICGVVYDEYSQQPSNIHSEIVFPMLNANWGWALWIGTPKGNNSFYDLYHQYKEDEDWYVRLLTCYDTKILTEEQIGEAKKALKANTFKQEYLCDFNAAIDGAIYGDDITDCVKDWRVTKWIYERMLPVFTFWDLGMSDYTSIVFAQFSGQEIRIIDSLQMNGKPLDYYVNELAKKNYRYEMHYLPHDAKVRELGSGMSRLEMLKKSLMNVKLVKNIGVKDGIDAVRVIFDKIWFEESKTKELRNCLAMYQYEWDDERGMFKDRPLHNWTSHFADSFRYMAVAYREITNKKGGGVVFQDYGYKL